METDLESNGEGVWESCLEVYFNASAKRLCKRYTVIKLPYAMSYLMAEFKAASLDSAHFQLRWREVFKRYDLPHNAKLESYEPSIHSFDVIAQIRNRSKILKDGMTPESLPALTKIVQFYYDDIPWRFAANPAMVSYYYGSKLLCKFDVYYELPQSLGEVEILAARFDASKYEFEQMMSACIQGDDIYNPYDVFDDNGRPLNYIEFLRWQEGTYEPDPNGDRLLQVKESNDTGNTLLNEELDTVPLAV